MLIKFLLSWRSRVLIKAYRFRCFRGAIIKLLYKLGGGAFHSVVLRDILRIYHRLDVGAYSYGPCLRPGGWPGGVTIGRYTSVAEGVQVFRRNHPMERLSMHPFFYSSALKVLENDNIDEFTLYIGNDVWIGSNVVITTGCKYIGNGAVIAAGAVVTKDIPDFSIWGGVPAKLIKMRFSDDVIKKIEETQWWDRDLPELVNRLRYFTVVCDEPLLDDLTRTFDNSDDM